MTALAPREHQWSQQLSMEQADELSDYVNVNELSTHATNNDDAEKSGVTPMQMRLFRIAILTLGVLCIIQAILNITLSHAFYTREDTDQLPFNSSVIAGVCQSEWSQQNSTQFCSCCNKLLRRLLREYKNLETERDILRNRVTFLTKDDDNLYSGSGSQDPSNYI